MKSILLLILNSFIIAMPVMANDKDDMKQKMTEWFEKCDSNKDGMISKDEYTMKKMEHFYEYDTNKDNMLSRSEHDEMLMDKKDKLK